MLLAPTPLDDTLRVCALDELRLVSTPAEIDFDRVTRVAAGYFGIPIALISLVDSDKLWLKSRIGVLASTLPRNISFCGHAILSDEVFLVPDARADPRFADNPLVTADQPLVFYAGVPIRNADGYAVGSLCVIDHKPREFTAADCRALEDLAAWLKLVMENRRLGETQAQLVSELDHARRDSMVCPLTQVWNRRGFSELIAREIDKAVRDRTPLALAMIDIDHFKHVNDQFGHLEGDAALVQLATILREHIRTYDILARFGGEEFVIVMPGVKTEDVARMGEKLRAAVENASRLPDGSRMTISIGVGWFRPDSLPISEDEMVAIADGALYRAKENGRNQVVLA